MTALTTEYQRGYRARWRRVYAHNSGLPWTETDRDTAIRMRAQGRTCAQIAIRVRRTPDAVHTYLRDLPSRKGTER
jgi:hypothetical protein